jgi:hypothetical protein
MPPPLLMRKLVIFLSLTTAVFATSTAWLAYRLHDAGADSAIESALAAGAVPNPAATAATRSSSAAPPPGLPTASARPTVTPPAGTAASTTQSAQSTDRNREMMTSFARDFLRQYDDPVLHATLLAGQRTEIEPQYSRLKERLKLDDATYNQLITLLAEEFLEQQANHYRCVAKATCDLSNPPELRSRYDEYLALLGPDGNAELTNFRRGLVEWQTVAQLRGRLSEANYLSDRDAERFMRALTEERERYMTETQQSGATSLGWGNGSGMLWYLGDGTAEQQLASAALYSDRMRKRAATVLSAQQLRAYVQLQDELLLGLASSLGASSGDSG